MPSAPLAPPEERLLRALWSRGTLTAAKADSHALERLQACGWVERVDSERRGGAPRFELTDQGRRLMAKLPPAKPTLADLARSLCNLQQEVEALRAELAALRQEARKEAVHPPTPPPTRPLTDEVREAWHAVNQGGRYAGLVPIPVLRTELARRGWRGREVDEELLSLEEQYVIDLKVANDPSRVACADDGVHVPERGLLYYAVLR